MFVQNGFKICHKTFDLNHNLERQSDYNSGIDWDLIIFKYQM